MNTTTEEQNNDTEERMPTRFSILEAAALAFEKNGFQATTMDDIAESAGVARRSIYHHFKSKKEILIAACITQAKQFLEEVENNVQYNGDFPAYVVDCLIYVIEQSPQSTLFMLKIAQETDLDPIALYFNTPEFIQDWVDFFQKPYTEAINSQQLNPDVALTKLVNWFGRVSTSYLQYPLEGETKEDIRDSVKVFFLSALKFNTYRKL